MRVALCVVVSIWSAIAGAQSWGPRTLDELKQETVRRAERNIVPLTGIKAADAREAMANLSSLEPDDWAAAWSRIGERYFASGDYFHAWDIFNVARWPSEKLSPGKEKAYARALEALRIYGARSEEHTSELKSPVHLVCRLLLEKK